VNRRDLSRALIFSASLGAGASERLQAQGACARPCYPPTPAEGVNAVPPPDLSYPPGNVLRWGADPTGAADSTQAIQRAVNVGWAAGNYASPWSGQGGATPVITFPPGRYRVTGTIIVPTGVTLRGVAHPANTESHTRIIMDSPAGEDNRDKPIFRFNRATLNNRVLMNRAITSSIEELEFWYVTLGGTFDRPLAAGIPFGRYTRGGCLMFDVDSADTRIVNCVFQHAPAAIRIKAVPQQSSRRGDGWNGNWNVGMFVENCEFDASCTHVYATDSDLDLQFKGCQFFGAMHRYERCTGRVVYQSGRWHGGAYVDAATVPNSLSRFELKAADIELPPETFLALNRSQLVDISQNSALGAASPNSWLEVTDADGGCILSNAINNSGENAPPGTGIADFKAAIKLRGCRAVLVGANNITASGGGAYNGFGILSGDSRRQAYGNFIDGNSVSAPYDAGGYDAQNRYINTSAGDVRGVNYSAHTSDAGALARDLPVQTLSLLASRNPPSPARDRVVLFLDGDGSLQALFPNGTVKPLASDH
jgi:hypothetical protein